MDEKGNTIVKVGDEVKNSDAQFFVGAINESQQLCSIDKGKPWSLLNEGHPMAAAIKQGNYAASAQTLKIISENIEDVDASRPKS
jgi:hypothetical protein